MPRPRWVRRGISRDEAGVAVRILLTGADGYIGIVMADVLMQDGFDVTGIDAGFYRDGWLYRGVRRLPPVLFADTRDLTVDDLRGYDAVVHLAELSNDPLGQLAPDATYAINHKGSIHVATLAREAGVERFVYMSSCSVYGVAGDSVVDETSPTNPQTAYAHCKVLVEQDLSSLATDSFHPVKLRNATAFGASPRMRFDVVLNNLMGLAWTTGEITMLSDGTPWRPLVHIRDTTAAVIEMLRAPAERIHDETFNVGSNAQNYRVREIAEVVAETVSGATTSFGPPSEDNRSYRVSFDKIASTFPNFACRWDARAGAEQLAEVFGEIGLDAATFAHRNYTRLDQLTHLMSTNQLNGQLHWQRKETNES